MALIGQEAKRFDYKIDPNLPLEKWIPHQPLGCAERLPWLVSNLTDVPEVLLQKPIPVRRLPEGFDPYLEDFSKVEKVYRGIVANVIAARTQIGLTLAAINHLSKDQPDRFLAMLIEGRADLRGLPFLREDACRMDKETSRKHIEEATGGFSPRVLKELSDEVLIDMLMENGTLSDEHARARIAVWMQTSPQDQTKRRLIPIVLDTMQQPAANIALAKLAVFAPEKDIRNKAIDALKRRPVADYTSVLFEGLRYPWAEIADQAAEAIVKLNRRDLVGRLTEFLQEPDPRAPFDNNQRGKNVTVIRELVRLNHRQNCILCHAPATSDLEFKESGSSSDFVAAVVPTRPDDSFGVGYANNMQFPDLAVRVDVTYLRPDFSLLQKGRDDEEPERYDFLVRTRELRDYELILYRDWLRNQPPQMSPNHQAALWALRQLTAKNVLARP